MTGTRIDRRLLLIMYLLAFILLREWLIPIIDLTDSDYLKLFSLFVILSFTLALIKAKWWIVVPVKLFFVISATHYVFGEKVLFTKETLVHLISDFLSNGPIIASGDWESITNPFRTMLFFSLLWMTTYLIRHWIEVRKSILLFYIMTVLFIAFIDTYSGYAAGGAIFRIMVTGLLLLGLLAITRLAEKHNTSISTGAFLWISVPLLFAVVLSGTLANFLPKQDPIWPDPLPYFESIVQGRGEGSGVGESKSGYDSNDATLGGSFVQDSTLVIEAKVASKQYWKIETKNTYTSKGWEQVPPDDVQTSYTPGMKMGEVERQGQVPTTPQLLADLKVSEDFPFIVYPYGMNKVYATKNVVFQHSEASGKYNTEIGGKEGILDSYQVEFTEPIYSLKELRATRMEDYSEVAEDLTQYLQLPVELPERVKDLAKTVTENHESVYEKTKAIEKYFASNGFVYTQQGVAIPKAGDDYVDQFLFDTKMGYCDNFSTSMVVMLRAIDIPARWVKGFAPGESVLNDADEQVYQITNNEAHSWVEAYMPGIGWMPYEPTIGFSGLTDVEYDIELDLNDSEEPEVKEPEQPEKEQVEKPVKKGNQYKSSELFKSIGTWIEDNIWIVGIIGFIGVLVCWRLFVGRVKWFPKILIFAHRTNEEDWVTFAKRFKSLLKQLHRFGLKRASGMTLADYAKNVDLYFGGDRMKMLTNAYEKGLYGGNITDHDWLELNEIWEDLINRTSG
ncbi:transglutaminase domain-containing protein [Sporosarcina sp. ANT_H38]|uniref:transglutaminase-like domain-containing protein n=1 Tax=Sporosarcina sp. ANT_H38 TaxID=2597358 RepID=UPI0011F1000F|nr:transglutaminase-like domain-containing protein [Sporosarcina sp. ANT_H38]KAA0941683.1 transglutaminase domain-containing protein [Sporosarcina sp. ANT_H38]